MSKRNIKMLARDDLAATDGLSREMRVWAESGSAVLLPRSRPDSSRWQAVGTIRKTTYRRSTETSDPVLAWEYCFHHGPALYRAAMKGEPLYDWGLSGTACRTFHHVAANYLEVKRPSRGQREKLERVLKHVDKDMPVQKMNQVALDGIAPTMFGPGVLATARNRGLDSIVKTVLRFAAVRGWCAMPKFDEVPGFEPDKVWIKPDAVRQLMAVSDPADAEMWLFNACYGPHLSEFTGLRRAHVDLTYGRLRFPMKTRKKVHMRNVPIFPSVRPMLERLLARPGNGGDQLFRRADGRALGSRYAAERYVTGRLRSAVALAGLDEAFTHKSFRNTMCTWVLSATHGSYPLTMAFGGWLTEVMVRIYAGEVSQSIVPDVVALYGLPEGTRLGEWLDLPGVPARDAAPGGLQLRRR